VFRVRVRAENAKAANQMAATTPILVIPGMNTTARVFEGQLDTLWSAGPVTIADHRQGATVAEMAEAILVNAPPRFALVSFSMGGYVAFEILRRAADRVLKAAFIATSPLPDTPESTEKRRQQIKLAQGGKFAEIVKQSSINAVHPDHAGKDWDWVRAIHVGMATALGPEVFVRHQEATIARPDSRPGLAAIKVPTAVIIADGDRVIPREASEEIAKGVPGAKLTVVPEAGHMLLLEQPDAVNAALSSFLSGT
jgi:pimeloyl-ACP methyl ester carboxylesterase